MLKSIANPGFLVISRIDYFADPRFKPRKVTPSLPISCKDILEKYKGIDGEPWPLENEILVEDLKNGLIPIEKIESVIRYYKKVSEISACDLLYLQTMEAPLEYELLTTKFTLCGYDFGCYFSEENFHSVIFHEIIFGFLDELRYFSQFLNNHLLLSSNDLVKELEITRLGMQNQGIDVEADDVEEQFGGIAVYAFDKDI